MRTILAASVAALMASAALTSCSTLDRLIVAGVPAQVDSKQHDVYGDPFSAIWHSDYTVTIEQCGTDIKLAQISTTVTHPSYDPATDSIAVGCFSVDYIVPASVYAKYQPGTEVTFAGTVGTPVRNIG